MIALPETQLRGSYTPLVTPFADGDVDFDAFARSVVRQADQGSHGIVVAGTTGEPTSLSANERSELYRAAVEAAEGRIPVVAATGSANQRETFELTAAAESAGVSAVLVVTPAFVKPSQEGLAQHFIATARRTELPVMIYNIPGRAGVGVSPATVVRVAEACENLVGIKHASPDLDLITSLLTELGDGFRIFCGLESYSYPMLALGAAGLMNAVGNIAPRQVAQLCDAVAADDHHQALTIHRELFAVNQAIFLDTNPGPLKYMLASIGLGSSELRPPLTPVDDQTRRRLDQALGTLKPEAARA